MTNFSKFTIWSSLIVTLWTKAILGSAVVVNTPRSSIGLGQLVRRLEVCNSQPSIAAHTDLIQSSSGQSAHQAPAQHHNVTSLNVTSLSPGQGLCRPSLISVAVYDNSVPHIFMLNICIKNWIPTPGSTSFLPSDHIPPLIHCHCTLTMLRSLLGSWVALKLSYWWPLSRPFSWPRQVFQRYLWDFLLDFKLGWLLWSVAKSVSPRCRIFINMTFAAVFILKT